MQKILITGGAGFIASSLADKLVEKADTNVVIIDNLLTGNKQNLPLSKHNNCTFIEGDCNKLETLSQLFEKHKFDYVFHYAAVVGVQRTLDHPLWVLEDIEGIKNILKLSASHGVKRFFYASSSEVYGVSETYPQHETKTALNARLPYAIVKNVGESYVESYHQEYGLPYGIFRFFNTYGAKQSPDFVVAKFMRLAQSNQPITIYGDGSQSRTFCFINDNLDACLKIMNEGLCMNDVINIGNHIETSVKTLAETIVEVTGSNSPLHFMPALAKGDMPRRQPDNTKMLRLLNRPLVSLNDGLNVILRQNKQTKAQN